MLFEAIKDHAPDEIALHDGGHTVSYGNLDNEILIRINSLRDVSVLAIALDNSVDWVLWDLAALKAGIPCVPIPPFFTTEQINHLIRTSGVSHLLSSDGLRYMGVEKKEKLPFESAKLTFTSGTTGTPKGVCLPKAAMERVARSIVDVLGNELAGKHVSILPLSVLLENVAGIYAGLIAGCTIYLPRLQDFGKNYGKIYEILRNSKANSAIIVPEILRILIAQTAANGPLPDLDFIAVGGSRIDPILITQARGLGLPVYEGYGLSECGSVVSLNTPYHDKPGTVGKILPHVQAHIVNGEIHIRDAGFIGYVGECGQAVLNTGDLGDIDGNGFLSVTGRKKNILITSYGRNISPEWVESALLSQPAIAQAVVYGDGKQHLSALIVPASADSNIQPAIDAANSTLPDYARVHDFVIVPPFTIMDGTLTGTGRPCRWEILNLYTEEKCDEFLQSTG